MADHPLAEACSGTVVLLNPTPLCPGKVIYSDSVFIGMTLAAITVAVTGAAPPALAPALTLALVDLLVFHPFQVQSTICSSLCRPIHLHFLHH